MVRKEVIKNIGKAKPAKKTKILTKKNTKKMQTAKRFPITFITGNKKKLEEFLSIMTGPLHESYDITNVALDLEEMQGTPESIALTKVKTAAKTTHGAVMTEDVSLCFNALGGLPGPYIKDFLTNVGREGLHKML